MSASPSRMPSSVLPVAVAPATTISGGALAIGAYWHGRCPSRTCSSRCPCATGRCTSRINFGAHTANMAEAGLPGERHIGYYRERALGGAGMIVVEPVPVHRTAVLTRGNFRHDDDAIVPPFRRLTDTCRDANPDIVMIQQLYHVGQHGDGDVSFAPNWSPSGLAVLPRRGWQPRHDRGRDRRGHRGLRRRRATGAGRGLRRDRDVRRVQRARRRVLDAVVEPPDRRAGAARSRRGCASRARSSSGIRAACGDDFIIGLAVSVDDRSEPALIVDELADDRGVARRAPADGLRHLRDGLVLRLLPDHPGVAVRAAARRPVRCGAQARRDERRRAGREPHPDARRGRGGHRRRPGRHGQHRPRPDRRPVSRRQGPRRPRGRHPAVHLVQPAVLGPAIA